MSKLIYYYMKKLYWLFILPILVLGIGCQEDLTAIYNRLDDLDARVSQLEKKAQETNENIGALQKLCQAVTDNFSIASVEEFNGGYTITLSNGEKIILRHGTNGLNGLDGKDGVDGKDGQNGADGKDGQNGADGKDGQNGADGKDGQNGVDGKDGQDGSTPIIAVVYDEATGEYYWTLNGMIIRDKNGNPIPVTGPKGDKGDKGDNGSDGQNGADGKDGQNGADGKDGQNGADGNDGQNGADGKDGQNGADGQNAPIPIVKVGSQLGGEYVADAWYLSVDGGLTWVRISGENGKSFFNDVTVDESNNKVTFVLSDGTILEIPYVKDFILAFGEEDGEFLRGQSRTIKVQSSGVVNYQLVKPDGWKVKFSSTEMTVTAPAAGNKYADTEGEVSVIGISKGGFATVAKYYVSLLKPSATVVVNVTATEATATVTLNEAAGSFSYCKSAIAKESLDGKSEEDLLALIAENEGTSNKSGDVEISMPEGAKPGDYYVVLVAVYDAAGNLGSVVKADARAFGSRLDLSYVSKTATTFTVHYDLQGSSTAKYAHMWCGPTSLLESYTGSMEDLTTLLAWLMTKPEGTVISAGTFRNEDEYSFSKLTPGTNYTVLGLPLTKKSGTALPADSYLTRLDVKTLSPEEAPQAEIPAEVVAAESDWLFASFKATPNANTKKWYYLCLNDATYNEYKKNNPDKSDTQMIMEQGAYFTSTTARTLKFAIGKPETVRLYTVGTNELELPGKVTIVSYDVPAFEEGNATVAMTTSEVTQNSARVVCKPDANTAYYYTMQGTDTQWKNISAEMSLYEYICTKGIKLTAEDDYTYTNLFAETAYTTYCIAVDKNGKYSQLIKSSFVTSETPGTDSEEYRSYVGTYTMTYKDWVTGNQGAPMTVTVTPRVVGKSYLVSGMMTPAYLTANGLESASVEARFENGNIVFYVGKPMIENPNLMFLGFTKGDDSSQPEALSGPSTVALTGTMADNGFSLVNNGVLTGKQELQGYLWYNTSKGGRADIVIPVDVKFAKTTTSASAPKKRQLFKALTDTDGMSLRYRLSSPKKYSGWKTVTKASAPTAVRTKVVPTQKMGLRSKSTRNKSRK